MYNRFKTEIIGKKLI